jgi:hypothetical protein
MKLAYIDFEFNRVTSSNVQLVCCSVKIEEGTQNFWLHDKAAHDLCRQFILKLECDGYTFVAYAVEAEARSFMSLHLEPTKFKWIDLYLEYRCLLNHNHSLAYGKQLIKGRVKTTRPPGKSKWQMTEEEKMAADASKPEASLAAACFKLLNIKIDTVFKDNTRDLIISDPEEFTDEEKKTIMEYCASDVEYLPQLYKRMLGEYKSLLKNDYNCSELLKEQLLRGDYAARTAKMVALGYPINYEATKAFSASVPDILFTVQNEINEAHPDVHPFELDRKKFFVWKQKKTRDWVAAQGHRSWTKTKPSAKYPKGQLSLSLDAFKRYYDFKHSYPLDNFGAQMVRFLTLKQNLNGFLPNKEGKKRKTFWDSVGSDKRVRPYFGIFGAQSSRSQPAATGFIPLKSAWMRSLIQPASGKAICGIDFASQEFLITALFYRDEKMIRAYESGDPYLWFGKASGGIPKDGTKQTHKELRDKYKATTLGLSYDMTEIGLAKKLTNDLGKKVTEEEAKKLVNMFNRVFRGQYVGKAKLLREYRRRGHIKLPCGWYVWGDNSNDRSVGNVPIQGFGASIMRKAVALAQENGLDVIYTLHDAIYIEYDSDSLEPVAELAKAMDEAFRFYFEDKGRASIRLEADIWSPDYEEDYFEIDYVGGDIPVAQKQTYIDPRGKKEYEKFKQYLQPINYDEIDI